MRVLQQGNGIPFVFLHGFLGTCSDWEAVCSFLPGRTCYGMSLPGHGAVPSDAPLLLPEEPIHLVGYSLGGRIAAQLPRQNLVSLTLLSTHPGLLEKEEKARRWLSDLAWAEKLRFSVPKDGGLPCRVGEEVGMQPGLKGRFYAAKSFAIGSIDDFLTDWYNQPVFGGFRPPDRLRPLEDRKALAEVLLKYSLARMDPLNLQDVFVCVGEKDQKLRQAYEERGKEVTLIPNATHILPLENPRAIATFLRSFS